MKPKRAQARKSALDSDFFRRSSLEVARDLIGVGLFVDGVGGRIVETEAYDPTEPASYSFGGRTKNVTPRCSARPGGPMSIVPTAFTGA